MELDSLLGYLGGKYDESKLVPPTRMRSAESRDYGLYPLGEGSFVNYEPRDLKEKFRVLAVDAGSASLFDTPYWGVGLLKLKARLIEFDPKAKRGTTVDDAAAEKFVLFLNDEGKGDDIVNRKFYEKGNYLKREEIRFIREQLKKKWLGDDDLLLVDGALSMQSFYERELLKMHKNIVGVSKRSGLTINRYAASSYLTLQAAKHGKAEKPWYCYPLVKEYPGDDPVAEIMFASFVPNSKYAFRVDFPISIGAIPEAERHAHVAHQLSKIALFSFDPKYRGYPYPLGAVHTDSVMRPIDLDRARIFVQQRIEALKLPSGAYELIRKDIENDIWYDKFRSRSH